MEGSGVNTRNNGKLVMKRFMSISILFLLSSVSVYNVEPVSNGVHVSAWNAETDVGALILSFISVESEGNDTIYGDKDDVGCLQITPVYVEEANRILGREEFPR